MIPPLFYFHPPIQKTPRKREGSLFCRSGRLLRSPSPLLAAFFCLSLLSASLPSTVAAEKPLSPPTAAAYSRSHGGAGLLILRDGETLWEECGKGISPHSPWPVFSITKFLVVLAGKSAEKEGLLSFRSPVSAYLPPWKNHPATLADLTNFSAGISSGSSLFYRKNLKDKTASCSSFSPFFSPASSFTYGPAGYEIFGSILASRLASRQISPLDWMQKKILAPCDASVAGWRLDGCGSPFYSTGANLSLRQLAKLGSLLLADGKQGFRRFYPSGILRDCSVANPQFPIFYQAVWRNLAANSPHSHEISVEKSIAASTDLSWWRSACLSFSAPPDLLALVGSGGQRLYLVPSQKLVVARLGKSSASFDDPAFLNALFSPR